MDLIALAIPFFLVAIIVELAVNWARGSGYFRANDAINSLSAGILSTTTGYFTRFIQFFAWGYVLQNFALIDMPLSLSTTSNCRFSVPALFSPSIDRPLTIEESPTNATV